MRLYGICLWSAILVSGCGTSAQDSPSAPLIRHITHQGVKLRYAIRPNSGKPLLFFVHGAPGSWSAHRKYLDDDKLLADFQLISVDRPGYGGSTADRVFASLEVQSRLISEILRPFAEKQPVILLGHSYGGPVVVRIAMDHPEWVQGLLLVAPAIDPSLEKRGRWRLWVRYPPICWLTPSSLYTTNEEIIALESDLKAMEAGYTRLRMPVYYLHGTGDILVPVANQYYAKRHIQKSLLRLRILEDVNHFIIWTHYEEVIKGIYYLRDRILEKEAEKLPLEREK